MDRENSNKMGSYQSPWIAGALIIALLFISSSASADHPGIGFGTGLAGPIITVPGTTAPQGSLGIDLRSELTKFSTFSDLELASFAADHQHVHSTDWVLSLSLGISYAFSDHLTLGFRLPYLYRNELRAAHHGHLPDDSISNTAESLGDVDGIGDLILFGQYRLLGNDHATAHTSVLFGLKLPTGETRAISREGERFTPEHQPGSGSWDPMLGVSQTWHWNSLSIDANVLHVFTSKGSQDTELGDIFYFNLALSHRLSGDHSHTSEDHHHSHISWDLILEANGESRGKTKIGNEKDEHTGGHILYLSPGMRLSGEGGMNIALSFGIPVWKDLNGYQSEPDYRTLLSMGVAF